MLLLGIDVGTTHCKVGVVGANGALLKVAVRPTVMARTPEGAPYYDPDTLMVTVLSALQEVMAGLSLERIKALGIASMAETGLLVDATDGTPRTPLLPWFDRRAEAHADRMAGAGDPATRFLSSGLPPSYKYGLAKLLWLREQEPALLDGARWLSTADFIAFRLTGRMATDPTLAARTYAYDVARQQWDAPWLERWDLSPELFPRVMPTGHPVGRVNSSVLEAIGGVPVAISGHDHLCAAYAAGVRRPGILFNSMGTAETLIGSVDGWERVDDGGVASGLAFGRAVLPGEFCWLGGLPASGGSVEWLRATVAEPRLEYNRIQALLKETQPVPTGILYFPYLSGSGAPQPDSAVRAAFVGLSSEHGQGDLLRAVLEGVSYEMEWIRRRAETVTGHAAEQLLVTGGGTRIREWLQIKADISGVPVVLSPVAEATVLGAAWLAGRGCGQEALEEQSRAALHGNEPEILLPDEARHLVYNRIFEEGYMPLQGAIRGYHYPLPEHLPVPDALPARERRG